ncbi:MAG TPA: permease [Campylobacteraceae bacterium]|nr:permease [Campylobacteraceae bacterium]
MKPDTPAHPPLRKTLKKAAATIAVIVPMLLAVVGLAGLFHAFVTTDMLRALFSGSTLHDIIISTLGGSLSVGQPVVSYVVGSELLAKEVSLYAVSAFMLAFVTLGLVQLPLEFSLFGSRFTLIRNLLAFLFAMLLAFVMTYLYLKVTA